MTMTSKLVDAVTQGTVSFFQTMMSVEVTPRPLVTPTDGEPSDGISAAIGISGDISGTMALHVPAPVVEKITEAWLGEALTASDPDARDAMGEIVNIVLGDAKTTMSTGNIHFTFSIPHVISGKEYSINYRGDISRTMVPFESSLGTFKVELATKEV